MKLSAILPLAVVGVLCALVFPAHAQFSTNPISHRLPGYWSGTNFVLLTNGSAFATNRPTSRTNAPAFDTNSTVGYRTNADLFTYNPTNLMNAAISSGGGGGGGGGGGNPVAVFAYDMSVDGDGNLIDTTGNGFNLPLGAGIVSDGVLTVPSDGGPSGSFPSTANLIQNTGTVMLKMAFADAIFTGAAFALLVGDNGPVMLYDNDTQVPVLYGTNLDFNYTTDTSIIPVIEDTDFHWIALTWDCVHQTWTYTLDATTTDISAVVLGGIEQGVDVNALQSEFGVQINIGSNVGSGQSFTHVLYFKTALTAGQIQAVETANP